MDNTESFVLTYALLSFTTVTILSLSGFVDIDLYFGLFAAELLLASEFVPTLDKVESQKRNILVALMILIFVGAIIKRIIFLSTSIL